MNILFCIIFIIKQSNTERCQNNTDVKKKLKKKDRKLHLKRNNMYYLQKEIIKYKKVLRE